MATSITCTNKRNGDVRAHKTGCRDIARETRPNEDTFLLGTFSTKDEVRACYNSDFDKEVDGWYDIDFAPCCNELEGTMNLRVVPVAKRGKRG